MSKIKFNLSLGCNASGLLKGGEFRWKHIVNESNLIWLDWYWEFYGIFNWHVSFENECSDRGMWVDCRPGCFSIVNYMFDCNLPHNIMEKIKGKKWPRTKVPTGQEQKNSNQNGNQRRRIPYTRKTKILLFHQNKNSTEKQARVVMNRNDANGTDNRARWPYIQCKHSHSGMESLEMRFAKR